jgi:hypothetical protein
VPGTRKDEPTAIFAQGQIACFPRRPNIGAEIFSMTREGFCMGLKTTTAQGV